MSLSSFALPLHLYNITRHTRMHTLATLHKLSVTWFRIINLIPFRGMGEQYASHNTVTCYSKHTTLPLYISQHVSCHLGPTNPRSNDVYAEPFSTSAFKRFT